MVSIGTSGVVVALPDNLMLTREEDPSLQPFPSRQLVHDGSNALCRYVLEWMKENLFGNDLDYDRLNALAAEVEAGSEGLIFLPYLYGERTPHADANARGVYFGISGKHDRRHFIRSTMEGVAYGLNDS